jgi:hypothetical protein
MRTVISGWSRTLTNARKRQSLPANGANIAWEFEGSGAYTGRLLIDGEIYTPSAATKKFLNK